MNEYPPDPAPELRTERMWLTSFRPEDADAVFAYASNPEVSRYTTWRPHTSISDAEAFLEYAIQEQYCWAIRLDADGPAMGAIECTADEPGGASIHYVLAPQLWGQGLTTEAASAVLDWAFSSDPSLQRITSSVVTNHTASRRVLEKCGMQVTGSVVEEWEKLDEPVELTTYALAREDWQRRSS